MQITADQYKILRRAHAAHTLRLVVEKFHGADGEPLAREPAEALVDIGADLARQYGMRGDYAAGILAYLTWQFGLDFDKVIPPMRSILLDPTIVDKANSLLDSAIQFWEIWEETADGAGESTAGFDGGAR